MRSQRIEWLGAIALFLPLAFLLPGRGFYVPDWINHQWQAAYFGKYFQHHLCFPAVFNTSQWSGVPVPIFYGFLLYPALGVLSLAVGPDVALRVGALAASALELTVLLTALRVLSRRRQVAWLVTVLVAWEIYPLTCLYHRWAYTEFIATRFLTAGIAAWMIFQLGDDAKRARWLVLAAVCLTFAAGAHPITGFAGGLCFLGIFAATVRRDRLREYGWLQAALALTSLLALSPFLYAAISLLTRIAVRPAHLLYYPEYDEPGIRLFPWPTEGPAFDSVSHTPFLEAQANVPLILLLAFLAIGIVCAGRMTAEPRRIPRRLLAFAIAGLFFSLLLSFDPYGSWLAAGLGIERWAAFLQMAYRLVTYINLFALLGVIALVRSAVLPSWSGRLAAAFCVVLSAVGLAVKLAHVAESSHWSGRLNPIPLKTEEIPYEFYGLWDYTTNDFLDTAPATTDVRSGMVWDIPNLRRLELPMERETTGEATITLEKEQRVAVNIYPFSWNRVVVDGAPLPASQLHAVLWWVRDDDFRLLLPPSEPQARNGKVMFFSLPAGTHRIGYRFDPPAAWRLLRRFSLAAIVSMGILLLTLWLPWPIRIGRLAWRRQDQPLVG